MDSKNNKTFFYTKDLIKKLKKKKKVEVSDNIIIVDNIVLYNGKKRRINENRLLSIQDSIYIITMVGKEEIELDTSVFQEIKKELLKEKNGLIFYSSDINSFVERINIEAILHDSITAKIQYYPNSQKKDGDRVVEYIQFDDICFVSDSINSIGETLSNIFKTTQYKIYKVRSEILQFLKQEIAVNF